MRTPTIDYYEMLAKSNDEDISKRLKELYQLLIPNFLDVCSTGNGRGNQFQLHGMDKIILTAKRELQGVEEKIRFKAYNDFLFEYVSNTTTNATGWTNKDLWCKWLVYYSAPIDKVYIWDWLQWQEMWNNNKHKWIEIYPTRIALNDGYKSLNVEVPEEVVLNALPQVWTSPTTTAVDLVNEVERLKAEAEEVERMEWLKINDIATYNFLNKKNND